METTGEGCEAVPDPEPASPAPGPEAVPAKSHSGPGLLLGLYSGLGIVLGAYNLLEHGHYVVPIQAQLTEWWILLASLVSSLVLILGASAVIAGRRWGAFLMILTQVTLPLLLLASGFSAPEALGRPAVTLTVLAVLVSRRWQYLR